MSNLFNTGKAGCANPDAANRARVSELHELDQMKQVILENLTQLSKALARTNSAAPDDLVFLLAEKDAALQASEANRVARQRDLEHAWQRTLNMAKSLSENAYQAVRKHLQHLGLVPRIEVEAQVEYLRWRLHVLSTITNYLLRDLNSDLELASAQVSVAS